MSFPEPSQSQSQKTIPARPDESKLPMPGRLVFVPYDSSSDEDETGDERSAADNGPPLHIISELKYNAMMAAKKEEEEIMGRSGETSEAQASDKPKRGQWLCVVKSFPKYCKICDKYGDHLTLQCRKEGDKFGNWEQDNWMLNMKCGLCLKVGHTDASCPYMTHVRKGEKVGPAGILICRCCGTEGGHPGNKWIGRALIGSSSCKICGRFSGHKTEDCPKAKVAERSLKRRREDSP